MFSSFIAIIAIILAFQATRRLGRLEEQQKELQEEIRLLKHSGPIADPTPKTEFKYEPEFKPRPEPQPEKEDTRTIWRAEQKEPAILPPMEGVGRREESPPDFSEPRPSRGEQIARINWERWVGVRGAALLGGIVLALAGLLFFKYSIEHGLLSPFARVLLGMLTGLAALVISEVLRKRGYTNPSNALSGAGIVILYVCSWAASQLYHLIGTPFAFVLIALTTAACAALSLRYESQFIGVLGVLGGFLTPVRLSTGSDRYLAFFSYVFLIDIAFLWIAHKRRWSSLLFVVMGGTFALQALWILNRMGTDRLPIGLAILALFTLLFAGSYYRQKPVPEADSENKKWNIAHLASLFGPYLFLFYFAQSFSFTNSLFYPFALFLLFLTGLSVFISFRQKNIGLAQLAAGSSSALLLLWSYKQSGNFPHDAWVHAEVLGTMLAIVALFTIAARRSATETRPQWQASLFLVYGSALLLSIILNLIQPLPPLYSILGLYWMGLLALGFSALAVLTRPQLPIVLSIGILINVTPWFFSPLSLTSWRMAVVLFATILTAKVGVSRLRSGREKIDQLHHFLKPVTLLSLGFLFLSGFFLFSLDSYVPDLFLHWILWGVFVFAVILTEEDFYKSNWLGIIYGSLLGLHVASLTRNVFFSPPDTAVSLPLFYRLWIAFLIAIVLQAVGFFPAFLKKSPGERRSFERSSATFVAMTLLLLFFDRNLAFTLSYPLIIGTSLLFGLCIVLSATRVANGFWYMGTLLVLAGIHTYWTVFQKISLFAGLSPQEIFLISGLEVMAVLFFTFWPFLKGSFLLSEKMFWITSALAAPVFFPLLRILFIRQWGNQTIGILPILLSCISLSSAVGVKNLMKKANDTDISKLVWPLAATLALISVAIPLQLKNEWVTVGWAVEGFLLIQLWKRLDHAGLKYYALTLLAAVAVRLLFNDEIFHYHERSGFPVVNWLLYTYLIPAAALVGAALTLSPLEKERARAWEKTTLLKKWPVGTIFCGMAAILVGFAWINLSISDYFGSGSSLTLDFKHHQAKDLTASLAWALYAVILLAIGMYRKNKGLRWVSLVFLIITILKVFLYDLGELQDLYRVMSLVGLAISLLAVSLAYQRFVFRTGDQK